MNIRKKGITVALACRTRRLLLARKVLYAPTTIHTTTVILLLAGLTVLVPAVFALSEHRDR